jgi:hypothetical protein
LVYGGNESDVLPFNTEDEMDDYILNHPNTTQAGIPKYKSEKEKGKRKKGQRTKDKGQRTKDKGQRTKDKGQRTKDKGKRKRKRKR